MKSITFEIDNEQDYDLLIKLAKRLGFKYKSAKNGKDKTRKLDETTYLLSTKANKEALLTSIENVKKGENLTEINLDDIKKQYGI